MSLAIKFGDSQDANAVSGVIYFDAVTEYSKDYGGRVTEHPIEAGASVSDHFISANPKFRISGIISSVDFSSIPSSLMLDGEPVLNNGSTPTSVSVVDLGGLTQYLPGVVTQFLPSIPPTIVVDPSGRTNYKMSVEILLEKLLSGLYYNEERKRFENRMTPTTLFEMQGNTPTRPIQDLIITRFSSKEDADSGDALMIELALEQVRFVTLEKVDAPKAQKGSPTARATSEKKNKGNATTTTGPLSSAPISPPSRQTTRGELESGREAMSGGR